MTPRKRVTQLLLTLIGMAYLLVTLTGGTTSVPNLLRFGALTADRVLAGEYWRLITPMFLHVGIWHLLFNSYALWQLGQLCESLYGSARFALLFVVCGIGGSLLSITFNKTVVSAGASGAIFGLAGLLLSAALARHAVIPAHARSALIRSMAPFVGYNFVFGFLIPGIDNFGHLGGLLTGAALGWLVSPGPARPAVRAACAWLSVALIGGAVMMQAEVGRQQDPRGVERDVEFFLRVHREAGALLEQIGDRPAANTQRNRDMARHALALREEVQGHWRQPALDDARAEIADLLEQLATALALAGDATRLPPPQWVQRFDQWTETMVAWAAQQGYVLESVPPEAHAIE